MNAIAQETAITALYPHNRIDFEARRRGLGGSDIAAALGVNPFKTAYELYLEKVEGYEVDLSNNEAAVLGNLLEDPIANKYEALTSQKLACIGASVHSQYPFIRGNPDRFILNTGSILEIKTTNDRLLRSTGKPISDALMEAYMLQVSHYMLVSKAKTAELAIVVVPEDTRKQLFCRLANHIITGVPLNIQDLVDELDIYRYAFERDGEIEKLIIEGAHKFWKEHVEKRIPPDIDYTHPLAKDCLRKKYNLVSEEIICLSDEFLSVTDRLQETKEQIKKHNQLKDKLEAKILAEIQNAGIARLSDGRCFVRKKLTRKGYTVATTEHVTLNLRQGV